MKLPFEYQQEIADKAALIREIGSKLCAPSPAYRRNTVDKPEFCYAYVERSDGVRVHGASWWSPDLKGVVKFHIIYNEAGEVVRLERVET